MISCTLLLCYLVTISLNQSNHLYFRLAEVPSVAWVLNCLSVDSVYLTLLLYPPEPLGPSLSCCNLLLGSLLCPWHACSCWIQHAKVYIPSSMTWSWQGINEGKFRKEETNSEFFSQKLTWKYIRTINLNALVLNLCLDLPGR